MPPYMFLLAIPRRDSTTLNWPLSPPASPAHVAMTEMRGADQRIPAVRAGRSWGGGERSEAVRGPRTASGRRLDDATRPLGRAPRIGRSSPSPG